jgi:hypothetical protein
VLGCSIDEVPPLDPDTAAQLGVEQGVLERSWLASIGYDLMEIGVDADSELPQEVLDCIPEDLTHFISGVSPRGFGHRCVGVGGELAWDPHPSREGLVTVYSVGFLVPL